MVKKNNILIGGLAVSALGAGVIGAAGTHITRTQESNNGQIQNKVLLASSDANIIPLDQSVIKTTAWISTWDGVKPGNYVNDELAGTKLSFDTNSMKMNVTEYTNSYYSNNPGQHFNNGIYTQYTLFNSNLKQLEAFTQENNGTVSDSSLNGGTFNYGDILELNAGGTYQGLYLSRPGEQGSCLVESGAIKYYEITKAGLVPLNGVYGKKVFENGVTVQNTWYTASNGEKYYAGSNGEVTTGNITMGNKIYTFSNSGVLQSEEFVPNISFNSWQGYSVKGNTLQLSFNNGEINATGIHKWMGSNASNSYLDLTLYSNSGSSIKNWNMGGTTFGNDNASLINGQNYNNGDILFINSSFPYANSAAHNTIEVQNEKGQISNENINGKIAYEITKTGLVPINGYKKLGNEIYDFVNGVPKTAENPTLSGVNNIKITVGAKFNPMEGVKLTDAADPNAKIEIEGTVNTEKAGSYTLTYKVTDSFGRTVTATRIVTVMTVPVLSGTNNIEITVGAKFNPMEGVKLTDSADPNAKIEVEGTVNTEKAGSYTLTYKVTDSFGRTVTATRTITVMAAPVLSGVQNTTISYGSKFNPMEGVKLTDAADPNAKIEVEGTVNTEKAGNYTLTYKVTDSFGRTVTATRVITVSAKPMKSTVESSYWTGTGKNQSLVINGKVDSKEALSWKVDKKLVIENSKGEIVKTINTATVNWYSSNKEDYSGFQGIISAKVLSTLQSGQTYNIAVEFNGKTEMLNSTVELPVNSTYYLGKDSNGITISRIGEVKGGSANIETAYKYNNGLIVNANLDINGQIIPGNINKEIVITNSKGEAVYTTNSISVNWYSSNKENYSGLQGYIPESVLAKINDDGNYTINVKVLLNGKVYMIPLQDKNINIELGNYVVSNNSNNVVTIAKKEVKTATATIEAKYQDGENTIENLKLNVPNVQANSKVQLKLTNDKGEVTTSTGILVNWYSKEKSNYNGVQLAVNTKNLKEFKKAELQVIVGNITYVINLNL